MNEEGTWLYRVWQRLFSEVGQIYTPEFTRQDDWFLKHTWTEEQEHAYQEWFVRTAMKDLHLPKRLAVSKSIRMLGGYGWEVEYRKSDPFARNPIHRKHLAAAEGGALLSTETAALLRKREAFVLKRWEDHWLVGWKKREAIRFPSWQFAGMEVLPGVEEILHIFRSENHWRVLKYFLAKRHSLSEQRPLDLLRRGEITQVIKHAQSHAEKNTW
ncbi:MAG: hypothetical protein ACREIC_29695 [Limisphaerales bacterium]